MNQPPLVSIIVPVYNTEDWVGKTLDSLIAQSWENVEIICVNDGSTDNSAEVLNGYARQDRRVKVMHQPNAGVAAARNTGLAAARSRYVAFADSDDWLEPDACEKAVRLMLDDPDLDYVCWGVELVYGRVKPCGYPEAGLRNLIKHEGKQRMSLQIVRDTLGSVWNKLFKLEIIRKYDIQFPHGHLSEDVGFWHKYAAHSLYGYYVADKLYNYNRTREDSLTRLMPRGWPSGNGFGVFLDCWEHYQKWGLCSDGHRELLSHCFIEMYRQDWSSADDPETPRQRAQDFLSQIDLPDLPDNVIRRLRAGLDHNWTECGFWEKIFSVRNRGAFKIVTIMGKEFKVRRRKMKKKFGRL